MNDMIIECSNCHNRFLAYKPKTECPYCQTKYYLLPLVFVKNDITEDRIRNFAKVMYNALRLAQDEGIIEPFTIGDLIDALELLKSWIIRLQ